MAAAGFERVTFLDVPDTSHYDRAPILWWGRAMEGLDGEPTDDHPAEATEP
jgi:hypothetical protein